VNIGTAEENSFIRSFLRTLKGISAFIGFSNNNHQSKNSTYIWIYNCSCNSENTFLSFFSIKKRKPAGS